MDFENYNLPEYDSKRLFILNLPLEIANANRETLQSYGIKLFTAFDDKNLIAVSSSGYFRNILCQSGTLAINSIKYKVVKHISTSNNLNTKEKSPYLHENIHQKYSNKSYNFGRNFFFPKNNERKNKLVKKSFGRGLLSKIKVQSDSDSNDEVFVKSDTSNYDTNNTSIDKGARRNVSEIFRKIEKKLPDFFKNINDEAEKKERKSSAIRLYKNCPELFEEYDEQERAIFPYPDMSLQDEVFELFKKSMSIEIDQSNKKKGYRQDLSQDIQNMFKLEKTSRNLSPEPERRLPVGTLIKPSDLPTMINESILLEWKQQILESNKSAYEQKNQIFIDKDEPPTVQEKSDQTDN